ncbi:MAG TPA: rod-binding protein [Rhizomicrobium sp.]|nr:rod-binding protein [Rhizomicrobium sp.]
MDAAIQTTMAMAQQTPLASAPKPTASQTKADWAAKEYESVFISQFLGSMFSGIQTDSLTGGGQGEEMFRSLMINEYGKSLEQRGGFGLAAQMKAQLLKHQETAVQ